MNKEELRITLINKLSMLLLSVLQHQQIQTVVNEVMKEENDKTNHINPPSAKKVRPVKGRVKKS